MKSYKQFVKEYSMGLQVPSTSYLKGVGSLQKLTKKEYMAVGTVGMDRAPLKKKNETSSVNTAGEGGVPARSKSSALSNGTPLKRNEVSDKLKGKVLDRKIARAKTKFKSKAFLSKP